MLKESNITYSDVLRNMCAYHHEFLKSHFDTIQQLDHFIYDERIRIIEARNNDELVGVSMFIIHPARIHLNYTLVNENYRILGINKQLKKTVEEYAKSIFTGMLTANVRFNNIPSLNTFISCGFKEVNGKIIDTSPGNTLNYDYEIYPDGTPRICFCKLI